jgi:phage tail-like protein
MRRSTTRRLSLLILAAALLLTATAPAQADTSPLGFSRGTAIAYSLSIDGVEVAQFSELAAMSESSLTFKRGQTNSMDMFAWHQSVVEGQLARKSATLVMYASDGAATARYHLESAWPAKIEIGSFKAGASEVLYETLVLNFDSLRRI